MFFLRSQEDEIIYDLRFTIYHFWLFDYFEDERVSRYVLVVEIPADAETQSLGVHGIVWHREIPSVALVEMVVADVEPQFFQSEVGIDSENGIASDFLPCVLVLQHKLCSHRVVVGRVIFCEEFHVASQLYFQHFCEHKLEVKVSINREGGEW